jgi:hypothetical protein
VETTVVEESASESVPEAPSTAARRASARSRTSKLEPAVVEETTIAVPLPSTGNSHVGDDSVLDIDDVSAPQQSSSRSSVSATPVW